ncbi:MAG: hypothetical protein JWM35_981 [Verrucomicrobia bacterium]|nr:hypothetical protein [Verrucomicrobiota bacterium]
MKNEPAFKLVAAVILMGVFLALFSSARADEAVKGNQTNGLFLQEPIRETIRGPIPHPFGLVPNSDRPSDCLL